MTETQLQNSIIELCKLYGWLYYHTHDSRRSVAGFPDLVIVKDARIIFAELKKDGRHATAEQEKWLAALHYAATFGEHISVYLWNEGHWNDGTILETLQGK